MHAPPIVFNETRCLTKYLFTLRKNGETASQNINVCIAQ